MKKSKIAVSSGEKSILRPAQKGNVRTVRIKDHRSPQLDGLLSDSFTALMRVSHLISVYIEVRQKYKKQRGRVWTHLSDILRASVVLCHASLEEFLRGIIYIESDWNDELLQKVSLLDDRRQYGGERFCMSDLKRFEDYKVSDLISESVYEHLRRRSFSKIEDIVWALRVSGITTSGMDHLFPKLDSLMQRRHSIAHTGDIDEEIGRGHHSTKSIGVKTVEGWAETVGTFFFLVADEIGKRCDTAQAPVNRNRPTTVINPPKTGG